MFFIFSWRFSFEIRRLFADERRTAVPAPSSLACSRNEMSPPGWATSSYGIPRSWLIGAGISAATALDGGLDEIWREEGKRDCHIDLADAALFSLAMLPWLPFARR